MPMIGGGVLEEDGEENELLWVAENASQPEKKSPE